MSLKFKYITFLDSFNSKQAAQYGLTAKHLYDLTQLNIDVPNSFFISSSAFDDFVHNNHLKEAIVGKLLQVDINDAKDLERTAKQIQEVFLNGTFQQIFIDEITTAYSRLSGFSPVPVKVNYSPVNEDLDYSVFENGKEQLNTDSVKGEDVILQSIKNVWASLFDPRAIFFREAKRYTGILTAAVVVQKLPFAECSGILFTSDPITNSSDKAQIEAILGVIDPLLNADLVPDVYTFDKEKGQIIEKHTVTQEWMLVRKGRAKENEELSTKVNISSTYKKTQKLDDHYIEYLGKLASILEKYNSKPLEAEWLLEGGRVSITKVRPMTSLSIKDSDWKLAPTVTALKSKLMSTKPVEEETKVNSNIAERSLSSYLHEGKDKGEYEKEIVESAEKIVAPMTSVITPVISTKPVKTVEHMSKIRSEVKDNKPKAVAHTATKIFSEVKTPSEAERVSKHLVDGVITYFGKGLLEKGIASNLLEVASRVNPSPVIFSLYSDADLSVKEINKQLTTLRNVRNKSGKKNVWLGIPAFADHNGITEVKKLASTLGLKRSSTFKVFVNVNSPAQALQIEDLLDLGIDGVLINYSKLVSLTIDTPIDEVKSGDLLTHNSIDQILSRLIEHIHKARIASIITFDYLELDLDVLKKVVQMGTGGIGTYLTSVENMRLDLQAVEAHRILSSGKYSK